MNRRNFICTCASIGVGASLMSLSACSLLDEKEMLLGEEKALKEKEYHVLTFNRKDIFVRFSEEKWEVFSLICTHKKCTVEYKAKEELFVCPCHDGTYNKEGKVIFGPPPKPLRHLKTEIRNGQLWVLNEFIV